MNIDFNCQRNNKIVLKEKSVIKLIGMSDIILITCDGYLTRVFIENGQSITISKLLKEFEIELEDYGFIRVNHNSIVNVYHIRSIERGNNRVLTLSNNLIIKISRRKLYKFNSGCFKDTKPVRD